jgi:hypothetical protein
MTLLDLLLVLAGIALGAVHVAQLVTVAKGALLLRRQRHQDRQPLRDAAAGAGALPGVSALVPAMGDRGAEDAATRRLVTGLFAQGYPDLEVIVVVDSVGSSALETWSENTRLQVVDPRPRGHVPTEHVRAIFTSAERDRLLIVDKRGSDHADALNAALNVASRPLVLAIAPEAGLGAGALIDAALPFALDASTTVSWTAPTALDLAAQPGNADTVVGGVDELRRARRRLESLASRAATPSSMPAPFVMALFRRDALLRLGGFEPYTSEPETSLLRRLNTSSLAQPGDVDVQAPAARGWAALASDAASDTPLTRGAALVEVIGWALVLIGLPLDLVMWETVFFFASAGLGLGLCVSLATLLADVVDGPATPALPTVVWYALLAAVEQIGPRQFAAFSRLRAWASPQTSARLAEPA